MEARVAATPRVPRGYSVEARVAATQALVFVVDSNDRERLPEAKEALHCALGENELSDAILLVFANKQDLPGAALVIEVTEGLGLHELRGRSWHIQACCSTTGDGLYDGINWIIENVPRDQAEDVASDDS